MDFVGISLAPKLAYNGNDHRAEYFLVVHYGINKLSAVYLNIDPDRLKWIHFICLGNLPMCLDGYFRLVQE